MLSQGPTTRYGKHFGPPGYHARMKLSDPVQKFSLPLTPHIVVCMIGCEVLKLLATIARLTSIPSCGRSAAAKNAIAVKGVLLAHCSRHRSGQQADGFLFGCRECCLKHGASSVQKHNGI